jgi:hypothetical protein
MIGVSLTPSLKELPQKTGNYLILCRDGSILTAEYDYEKGSFVGWGGSNVSCLAWGPIPIVDREALYKLSIFDRIENNAIWALRNIQQAMDFEDDEFVSMVEKQINNVAEEAIGITEQLINEMFKESSSQGGD